jgi:hypothetical protein
MYESNETVIETLLNEAPEHMDSSACTAEEWLELTLENEGLTAWGDFRDGHILSDFDDFDDLQSRWDDYRADWQRSQWDDSMDVDRAVEEEIDAVWASLTDYMDADDKFLAIQKLV